MTIQGTTQTWKMADLKAAAKRMPEISSVARP